MKKTSQSSSEQNDFFSFGELPSGWECKKLGEIISPSKEKIEPTEDSTLPYVGLEHIESNSSKIIGHALASEAKSTKTIFHSGDVLYGKLRPYLNKVTIPDFDGVCSTDILVFNQNQIIDSRYLMRYLSTRAVVEYANLKSKGLSLPRVSFESLAEIPIPLPPLTEQQQIIARVETLLTHVNTACERLSRMPLIMKKFRQAVLAAACTGRLTEDWRDENPDIESANDLFDRLSLIRKKSKIRTIYPIDSSDLQNLPSLWIWVRLSEIAIVMDPDHKMPDAVENGIIFISPKDFIEPNGINLKNTKKISDDDFRRLCKKFIPLSTDIIYSRIGTIGKVRKPPENTQFHISYSLAIIRALGEMKKSDYLYWALKNDSILLQAHDNKRSIGVPDLGLKEIDNFYIPLPPLAEQNEIVSRVWTLFDFSDEIEREVVAANRRCERLTQAVLGKAFRGELVPEGMTEVQA